ncbi:MAG: APC family permease [Aeromicrobium sp.]
MSQDTAEQQLPKTLRWHHGFMLALPISTSLFISVGAMIGAIGAWPAIFIGGGLSIVALMQNRLFAEMAAMFPDKSGGVPMYATEAWRRYLVPIGPLVTFGYWCGWALVLSLTGLTIGNLIQAQWLSSQTWVLFSTGSVDFGLAHVICFVALAACTAFNLIGIHVAVRLHLVIGAVFIVVLGVLAVGPFLAGGWNSVELTSHLDGGWKAAVVWIYVSAWTLYGTELCASFAPEYKDTTRDTSKALRSIALFMIFVYAVIPLATAGQLGEDTIAKNPVTYGVLSVQQTLGSLSGVVTAVLCAALFLGMVSSSADAGRALFGIAREGMTIRQLGTVNRRGMPATALVVTLLVNLVIVTFVGNPVAILIASNVGYILAITFAVFGFVLLRKDRPAWPRPIRLGRAWVGVALVLGVFNLTILVIGATNPGLTYAGGASDVLIGLVMLLSGLVLFVYRRIVQDRTSLRLREPEVTQV